MVSAHILPVLKRQGFTEHSVRPVLASLTRVVLPLEPNLRLLPHCLDLPPLPFSPADQITNEKSFEHRDQCHWKHKKDGGDNREVKQKAGGWVDVAKGFPEPRERERAQSTVNLLNERQENRNGDRSGTGHLFTEN